MRNVLEFIDYIFDRYSYLGVQPNASVEELRGEIRRRRAENHPDKLVHVSEAIRKTAEKEMDLVNDCARILLDETLRSHFDEKLKEFKDSAPHLISTSGTPILDPSRFRLDLESLLESEISDLSQLEAAATQMAGYNEKRLDRARARLAKDVADFDARELVREELTAKLVYLTVIEDYYWLRAGVAGAVQRNTFERAAHTKEVLDHMESTIEQVRDSISETVARRHSMAQLGLTPMLLLGHDSASQGTANITKELVTAATKAFDVRVEDLKTIVAQKKVVLDELVSVARSRKLNAIAGSELIDVMLVYSDADLDDAWPGQDFTQPGILLRLDTRTEVMAPVMEKIPVDQITAWPNELYALEPNKEIPSLFLEAVALVEQVVAERKGEGNAPSA